MKAPEKEFRVQRTEFRKIRLPVRRIVVSKVRRIDAEINAQSSQDG
jgi:hypothetical protein